MNAPLKRPVTLDLDAALLQRAERLAPDLAAVVERLLATHLAAIETQRQAAQLVAASNAVIERHGFWGEEFSTL